MSSVFDTMNAEYVRSRSKPTTPPPPLRADLSQRATELRTIAQQLLARANELDQIAERM